MYISKLATRLIFIPFLAIAGGLPPRASANTPVVTVVEPTVYMGSTRQGALIKISPAYPAGLGGCSYTVGDYVFIDFAAQVVPNGRDLYASVLAAFLAGHQVSFGTSGCTSDGVFPVVYGVNIEP